MKKDNNRRPGSKFGGNSGPDKGKGKFKEERVFRKPKPDSREEQSEKKTEKRNDFSKSREYQKHDPSRPKKFSDGEMSSFKKETGRSKPLKKNPEEGEYQSVYRGRGKNEKPVYERVPKTEKQKESKFKSKFKKPFTKSPDSERPQYNFEKIEKTRGKKEENETLRLNKYIANSGICSRREADQLIQKGEITVNGEVVIELGFKVLKSDKVVYKGKSINPEKPVYILMNKPKDFITTTEDPLERKTVMHLLEHACEERVFPVGRLDRNTTGLLLFTNDGELAAKLSHPSNEIKKIYQVTLDKPLTSNHEKEILEGLTLEDGPVKVDDMQVLSKDRTILGLEIHVGRNRIVRRLFAHLEYEVIALDRVIFAGLDKKDLPRGKYRFLSEKEVVRLKYFL